MGSPCGRLQPLQFSWWTLTSRSHTTTVFGGPSLLKKSMYGAVAWDMQPWILPRPQPPLPALSPPLAICLKPTIGTVCRGQTAVFPKSPVVSVATSGLRSTQLCDLLLRPTASRCSVALLVFHPGGLHFGAQCWGLGFRVDCTAVEEFGSNRILPGLLQGSRQITRGGGVSWWDVCGTEQLPW